MEIITYVHTWNVTNMPTFVQRQSHSFNSMHIGFWDTSNVKTFVLSITQLFTFNQLLAWYLISDI